jgi:hypothetical protein
MGIIEIKSNVKGKINSHQPSKRIQLQSPKIEEDTQIPQNRRGFNSNPPKSRRKRDGGEERHVMRSRKKTRGRSSMEPHQHAPVAAAAPGCSRAWGRPRLGAVPPHHHVGDGLARACPLAVAAAAPAPGCGHAWAPCNLSTTPGQPRWGPAWPGSRRRRRREKSYG